MAVAMMADDELAFQMQLNEAIAASLGTGSMDLGTQVSPSRQEVLAFDFGEIERAQKEAQDRALAAKEQQRIAKEMAQVIHDAKVAREVDAMDEAEWNENGDLFEQPFTGVNLKEEYYRVFFKGFPVQDEDGTTVGTAIGGAVFDPNGNQASELKRFLDSQGGTLMAQLTALNHILQQAYALGAKKIIAYSNSQTIKKQVMGEWKAGSKVVQEALKEAKARVALFDTFDLNLALHGENWPAENAARQAWLSAKQSMDAAAGEKKEYCVICLDHKKDEEMFTLKTCAHKFCKACVSQHAEAKIAEGQSLPVPCPQVDCSEGIGEEQCKSLLSPKPLELFVKKLEESRIPEAHRAYCPYKGCSQLMDRRVGASNGGRSRSCIACRRLFCVECRVPSHEPFTCSQFQLMNSDKDDAKLYKLAEIEHWRQCKQCKRMIELAEGCYHMTCKCGYEFCYTCGAVWKNKMQTCNCKLWDEHNIIRDEEMTDDEDDEDEDMEPPVKAYKTRLCRYFEYRGYCRFQEHCNFAHGEHELRGR